VSGSLATLNNNDLTRECVESALHHLSETCVLTGKIVLIISPLDCAAEHIALFLFVFSTG